MHTLFRIELAESAANLISLYGAMVTVSYPYTANIAGHHRRHPLHQRRSVRSAFGKLDPNKYGILPVLIVITKRKRSDASPR